MIFPFSCFTDTCYSNNRFLQYWKVQKAILTIHLLRPITLYCSINRSMKAHAFWLRVDEADDYCTISYPSNVTWLQKKCIYVFCTPTFCRNENNVLCVKKEEIYQMFKRACKSHEFSNCIHRSGHDKDRGDGHGSSCIRLWHEVQMTNKELKLIFSNNQ